MGTINRVVILGTIGHTPEMKFSRTGKPYVRLSLATHRRLKTPDGLPRRETQWHRVMLWGRNAEIASSFCEKGAPIYIEGHLAPYEREENGRMISQVAIVAEHIHFIPGSRSLIRREEDSPDLPVSPMADQSEASDQNATLN